MASCMPSIPSNCGRNLSAMKKEGRVLPRKIICNEIGFDVADKEQVDSNEVRAAKPSLKRKWLSNGWMSS